MLHPLATIKAAALVGAQIITLAAGIGMVAQAGPELVGGNTHAVTLNVLFTILGCVLSACVTVISVAWWLSSQLQAIKSDLAHMKEICPHCPPKK